MSGIEVFDSLPFNAVPAHLAMAHDKAQASALAKLNQAVAHNNSTMRNHLYPTMHALGAALHEGDGKIHDLSTKKAFSRLNFEEVNALYKGYRMELMDQKADFHEDEDLFNLFPDELTEIPTEKLREIEGKLKEWLDHCKNVNNQKTQDLYLMIQIGVALMTAFHNMQKEQTQSMNFMVRNQRH